MVDGVWSRSWLRVGGTPEAAKVSQGYIMQRYMIAASSRGALPVKFNGGLFTVGHDIAGNIESKPANHNADFRQWGGSYWNQNNRLLYWPLVQTGDFDLLKPWFELYMNALPLAKDRTRIYFHHGGAAFIETIDFWGLPNINDFGWDNPGTKSTAGGCATTFKALSKCWRKCWTSTRSPRTLDLPARISFRLATRL